MRIWCENEKKKYEIEHIYKTTYFVKSKFYYFDEVTFSDKKGKIEFDTIAGLRLLAFALQDSACYENMTHLFLQHRGDSSARII